MNEIISTAADILTIIGSSLAIILEARRTHREARKIEGCDTREDTQE